jgi:hypothetical protein
MNKDIKDIQEGVVSKVQQSLDDGSLKLGRKTPYVCNNADMERIHDAICEAMKRSILDMEEITLPYFGSLRVYNGKLMAIENVRKLKQEGYKDSQIQEMLVEKARENRKAGKSNKLNGFRI